MAYWKACEVRVISTWVCAVRNETDVAINEIHSEVERSELGIPEASNSLLGIKLRLPAWGEPPQLAHPLSICHLSLSVWKHPDLNSHGETKHTLLEGIPFPQIGGVGTNWYKVSRIRVGFSQPGGVRLTNQAQEMS